MGDDRHEQIAPLKLESPEPASGGAGTGGPLLHGDPDGHKQLVWKTMKTTRPIPKEPAASAEYSLRHSCEDYDLFKFSKDHRCFVFDLWSYLTSDGSSGTGSNNLQASRRYMENYEYWRCKDLRVTFTGTPSVTHTRDFDKKDYVHLSSGSIAVAWINDPDRLLALSTKVEAASKSRIAGRRLIRYDERAMVDMPVRDNWYYTASSRYTSSDTQRRFNSPGGMYIALCGVDDSMFEVGKVLRLKMAMTITGTLEFAVPSVVFLKFYTDSDDWPGYSGLLQASGNYSLYVEYCESKEEVDSLLKLDTDCGNGGVLKPATKTPLLIAKGFIVITFKDARNSRLIDPAKDVPVPNYCVSFSRTIVLSYDYKSISGETPTFTDLDDDVRVPPKTPKVLRLQFEKSFNALPGGFLVIPVKTLPGYNFDKTTLKIAYTNPTKWITSSKVQLDA